MCVKIQNRPSDSTKPKVNQPGGLYGIGKIPSADKKILFHKALF